MGVIVQKYGGSSVADHDRIKRVAARIAATRATGASVVVVVSAMGNTTNELLALARGITEKPDRRELDMLLSVGERISMALLSMALRDLGVPARSLTGSQSGIITDERHAEAQVVEVRPERVRGLLEQGNVVIVGGFQGVSREREVTTLGRGGSDTTAVVLAAALGAEHCEICSDVDGVWSADPRVVPEAVKLDTLTLDEALALARGGAKVLFEDALRYARDRGVAIVAASTFGPGSGTRIEAGSARRVGAVAVNGDDQLVRLPLSEAVRARAGAGGLRLRQRVGDWLWFDTRNAHGALDELGGEPVALVTAVGSGLAERVDELLVAEAALGALAGSWRGAAGDAAWWEVSRADCREATRRVHAALVG